MKVTLQRIRQLPIVLANQIAAGEVIERPASVVKELLENSLDAGATEIKLEIQKGGRSLIRISDNGSGIHPQDLSLALSQHATSKIDSVDGLMQIKTLGFRGEALSSIANIARLNLSSRIAGEEHGWGVDVQKDASCQPVAMQFGTCVEVRDLFFNIPARRKFLRADNTEFFHIREVVRRIALSSHHVAIHLQHNGKSVLRCVAQPDNVGARIQAILGQAFFEQALALDCTNDRLRLWGWFGHPDTARNQLDHQYLYLNGRMIRDKKVNHAVRMVTQDHLYAGKYATYVLFLHMEPLDFDINVHPAKYEVRFRHARDVHDFIFSALQQLFERFTAGSNGAEDRNNSSSTLTPEVLQQSITASGLQSMTAPDLQKDSLPSIEYPRHVASAKTHPKQRELGTNYMPPKRVQESQQSLATISNADHPMLYIGEQYLLIQIADQTFLLDIFLCQEIIILSKLEKDFNTQGIRSRPLLVPLRINVSAEQGDFFSENSAILQKFGLKLQRIASDSIVVREFPLLLEHADIVKLVDEMEKMIKSDQSDIKILHAMSRHVHDAGLIKMDHNQVQQMIDQVNSIKSSVAENAKRRAWVLLDVPMVDSLLQSKS